MLAKDEKKKVHDALKTAGLKAAGLDKKENIPKSKFTFQAFYKFYHELLGGREELNKIFCEIQGVAERKKKNYITLDQTVAFLNNFQRDPRLNEILFPHHSRESTKKIIQTYEADKSKHKLWQFTLEGFTNYLMSSDNLPINVDKLALCHNMTLPLSHYFINSSHNTYLTGKSLSKVSLLSHPLFSGHKKKLITLLLLPVFLFNFPILGHQFSGKSSVEIYRQCLLAGCRCVELDCWDGEDNEPTITHGFTLCSSVQFKVCLACCFMLGGGVWIRQGI